MVALDLTAEQALGAYKQGRVRRQFPARFLSSKLPEIEEAARSGDIEARTTLKLLFDRRFDK